MGEGSVLFRIQSFLVLLAAGWELPVKDLLILSVLKAFTLILDVVLISGHAYRWITHIVTGSMLWIPCCFH